MQQLILFFLFLAAISRSVRFYLTWEECEIVVRFFPEVLGLFDIKMPSWSCQQFCKLAYICNVDLFFFPSK